MTAPTTGIAAPAVEVKTLFRVRIESKIGSQVREVSAIDETDAVLAGKFLASYESEYSMEDFTVTVIGTADAPATKDGLDEQIRMLAQLRYGHQLVGDRLKAKRAAFDAEHSKLIDLIKQFATAQAQIETTIKAMALTVYEQEKVKKLTPGVEVKLFKAYTIDSAAGLEWAKEKKLCLIPESLDVEAVKKMALVTPLPFVTIKDEPKVQIATDLAKALPAIEPPVAPAPEVAP